MVVASQPGSAAGSRSRPQCSTSSSQTFCATSSMFMALSWNRRQIDHTSGAYRSTISSQATGSPFAARVTSAVIDRSSSGSVARASIRAASAGSSPSRRRAPRNLAARRSSSASSSSPPSMVKIASNSSSPIIGRSLLSGCRRKSASRTRSSCRPSNVYRFTEPMLTPMAWAVAASERPATSRKLDCFPLAGGQLAQRLPHGSAIGHDLGIGHRPRPAPRHADRDRAPSRGNRDLSAACCVHSWRS